MNTKSDSEFDEQVVNMTATPTQSGGRGSRANQAYQRLKDAIRHGEFPPGERMREAELAKWLDISRTPVRDALQRLEGEGLVVAAPRRGLIVTQLDQQQVTEMYALRNVLEGLAARIAATHASPAEISAMRDSIDRQRDLEPGLTFEHADFNRTFHRLMYRAARNRYLLSTLQGLESSLALLPGTTYSDPARPKSALREHTAIVDAIADHDADRAEKTARQHIYEAERIRLRMMAELEAVE